MVGESTVAGDGLFASSAVAAGDTVVIFGGRIVSTADLNELISTANDAGAYVDALHIGIDRHLVLEAGTDAHFGNHSCDPTLLYSEPSSLIARRTLRVGEELTVDYATLTALEDWSMECSCRSDGCRELVTGDDWKRRNLQERYGEHWVQPIRRALFRDQ